MNIFIQRNIRQIKNGGIIVFLKKFIKLCFLIRLTPSYTLGFFLFILIRLLSPLVLIRFRGIYSSRIGHFAAETEQYLCERDSNINMPDEKFFDIFYLAQRPICNKYLVKMWKRTIYIWPSFLVEPVHRINRLFPGSDIHEIGNNTSGDRDVHNLLDRLPAHIQFTEKENSTGKKFLESLGIKDDQKFVCLNARDSSYLKNRFRNVDFNYHNYRDSDIDNYLEAAEALVDLGFYVIRMGADVNKKIKTNNPKIIDYATASLRTDFLDIYLAGHCSFCISTGSGFDNIVGILRTPTVFVNILPIGYSTLFSSRYILIPKHHYSLKEGRRLSMREIFSAGVGYCKKSSCYSDKDIEVIENSPDEIKEASLEMVRKLEGSIKEDDQDFLNQKKFRQLFPDKSIDPISGRILHGKIKSKISSYFLRKNPEWLA